MSGNWISDLEKWTREAQKDPRTTQELISQSLTEPDENAAWEAVSTLHYRATKDVFDAARQLCGSDCPQERTLGANILGQLGIPDRSYPEQSAAILLKLLEVESDVDVLDAICVALGHIHEPIAIAAVARFKTHPSSIVRYAVVHGLLSFEQDLAVDTLIELSRDQDDLVRDWATFGLGSMIETDAPQIRAALFARLSDADDVVQSEALVGLARRKDERIIEPLIQELNRYPAEKIGGLLIEAAEEMADTRLLPTLMHLKESSRTEKFNEAIQCCCE
jgi:HEAT repeat protein